MQLRSFRDAGARVGQGGYYLAMANQDLLDELQRIAGEAHVSEADAVLEQHSRDQSAHPAARPELVVWPADTAQVSAIAGLAAEHGVPLVAWGAGSSLEGNPIPLHGGIVVNFARMNRILELHEGDFQVTVQPGILYKDMNGQLAAHGLFFAPDPGANASIGGMIANNVAEGWLPNPLLPETRSELAVPISFGNQVIGVLDVQHHTAESLGSGDAELLQIVAAQVAVALQNAQLMTQVQTRADRAARLNAVSQRIQAATSIEQVLQTAVQELGATLPVEQAYIELLRPQVDADTKPAALNGEGR